uniref:Putative transglycosylase n=1 Tax=viral metagenome TaxID=1070528 RepID=A0A6M3LV46_9ZZZZ
MNLNSERVVHANRLGQEFEIDPPLIYAICERESRGNQWAIRPEVGYPYVWDVHAWRPFRTLTTEERFSKTPPKDFAYLAGSRTQEWLLQQSSIGRGQIMGANARAAGFKEPFLTALCDPWTGTYYAVKHLAGLLKRFGFPGGVSAYNHGVPHGKNDPYLVEEGVNPGVLVWLERIKAAWPKEAA